MTSVDLLIIGGGINGAGIARDAVGRGLSVMLCEQGDLAAGTSSASSKLIHGGLRYLEQGAFRLVRESLAERETLCRIAPHLVRPLCFVLPRLPGQRPAWMLRLGLALYDGLAAGGTLPRSRAVTLTGSPLGAGLRAEIGRGFRYWDCQAFDARLVVANAVDAGERGAVILTRTACLEARRDGLAWRVGLGAPGGVPDRVVRARMLVNAAGPWAARVLDLALGRSAARRLRLVKGSHIVVPRRPGQEHGLILQNTDGRVVFVLPYEDAFSLIGTTDVAYDGDPGAATVSDAEVEYLCRAVNRVLDPPLEASEIVDRFAGVRPLCDDGSVDPARVSREYVLESDPPERGAPLLTVFGGKLTTYRVLAERVLERLAPGSRPWTATASLPGGGEVPRLPAWLPEALARRLARLYGDRAVTVVGDARCLVELGRDFGGGLTEREVVWLVEREYAVTAADILWRRTKLGLTLSADQRATLSRWLADRHKP